MTLNEFLEAPTKVRHDAYNQSLFSGTAPEWSTGEVLLASAYRRLLLDVSEGSVDLDAIAKLPDHAPESAGGSEVWRRLLLDRGGLASPFRKGQSGPSAPRQLMPLVPSVAYIAGVLGKPRSRWNPSSLLLEAIAIGLPAPDGDALVASLVQALGVGKTDDVFARLAERAIADAWKSSNPDLAGNAVAPAVKIKDEQRRAFHPDVTLVARTPAERFCRDVRTVLDLKDRLTRRQWTVLVEATLRIGLGMHALWICRLNEVAYDMVEAVAAGKAAPTEQEVGERIWPEHGCVLLELGMTAMPAIVHHIQEYAYARTGINLCLFMLDAGDAAYKPSQPIGFAPGGKGAAASIKALLDHVEKNRATLSASGMSLRQHLGEMFDRSGPLRDLARCRSGYTSNLSEFVRHALGQIATQVADDRCYDLAYLLASPPKGKLIVQPGPDMLLTLVHACCANNANMPVSLDDFRTHLSAYGLRVPAGQLVEGATGLALTRLGLVVDSPDAAGGSLLVSPFD